MMGAFRALACLFVCGCIDSSLVPCGDQLCPATDVCTPVGCALEPDVHACDQHADGDACTASSGAAGACQSGVCEVAACGNGRLDPGEACDDGNQISGDGCRSDCQKVERCGDGVLDDGEPCDDGNTNAADGCDACALTTWDVTPVVGSPDHASDVELTYPAGVAVDGNGVVFIADSTGNLIRRLDPDGTITTIAGTGVSGFAGDGGHATSAQLSFPQGIIVDGLGRLFIADHDNNRVRRIDRDGTITTVAGTGAAAFSGDGGPATSAALHGPSAVAIDDLGRIVIADQYNHRIRRIDVDGTISTIAGTGVDDSTGDGGPATAATFGSPFDVVFDASGRLLIADPEKERVRRIELDGTITTIAGTGAYGSSGDGGPATSAAVDAYDLAFDLQGRLLISDGDGHSIRRIADDGTISSIAGAGGCAFSGDGGPATAAHLCFPEGLAVDPQGDILVADSFNLRIRRIDTAGIITTIAGSGVQVPGDEGRPATGAQLRFPYGAAFDSQGRLLISDSNRMRVLRLEADGTVTRVAGNGATGFSGDGGPATSAAVRGYGIAVDAQDRLYIADRFNNRIRRVDPTGIITTVAGNGGGGFGGDGGLATDANIDNPFGVAIDPMGRVLIADFGNSRIRRIELDGTITTVAGGGTDTSEGVAATTAALSAPWGVAVDSLGRISIVQNNGRVRRVDETGIIRTIAGTGSNGYSGDGGPGTSAQISAPTDVAVDSLGRVVIADNGNHRIRRVDVDGTITTIAGTGGAAFAGDGGPATSAQLSAPTRLAIDPQGRVAIIDPTTNTVRRIDLDGTLTTLVGALDPPDVATGAVMHGHLGNVQAMALDQGALFAASGSSGTLEQVLAGASAVVAGRYPQATATGSLAYFQSTAFGSIGGVAIDPASGTIYITETSANRVDAITRVDPARPQTWTIAPVVGAAGTAGFADGPASSALVREPTGLLLDAAAHVLYIADTGNSAIRALALDTGEMTTVINAAHRIGMGGDGGAPAAALLCRPTAIAQCPNGDLFIADTCNNRVRRIANGAIETVLGDGVSASSGEGRPAREFPVDAPRGLACDAAGDLFVSSTTTVRLLPADASGVIDGSGGVETIYGGATAAGCLTAVVVTGPTTVQVADECSGFIVALERRHL